MKEGASGLKQRELLPVCQKEESEVLQSIFTDPHGLITSSKALGIPRDPMSLYYVFMPIRKRGPFYLVANLPHSRVFGQMIGAQRL